MSLLLSMGLPRSWVSRLPLEVGLKPLLTSHIVTTFSLSISPYHLPRLGRMRSTGVASPPFDMDESDVCLPTAEVADGVGCYSLQGSWTSAWPRKNLEDIGAGREKDELWYIHEFMISYDSTDNDF